MIKALSQEPLGPNVLLAPLGEAYHHLIYPILDVDVAVIVKRVSLDGAPGRICEWGLQELRRHAVRYMEIPSRLRPLAEWMERLEIGFGLPLRLCFVFVEVHEISGMVLSRPVRAAMRPMVRSILAHLEGHGVLESLDENIARISRLSCLNILV